MENKNKQSKKDGPNRKARIIVRNLSFKTKEKHVRDHFSKYGTITEINILKRPDGKLVGCCFVQFVSVQMAAKAIYNTTGKDFLGRVIICDWAMPKNKFEERIETIKKEVEDGNVAVKEEKLSDETEDKPEISLDNIEVKEEVTETNENDVKTDEEKFENIKSDKESDTEKNSSDETEKEDSSDDDEIEIKEITENRDEDLKPQKKPRFESNDVSEGRTVFIKNVPFSATNEDLKECMTQFGPILYALVCMDPLTEYSKGTAFVKFVNKQDADKCLEAGTELKLMENILDCQIAVDRNTITEQIKSKKEKPKKDSRNLYLIKEGVILAGSKAAEGVSPADMAKRLQLEQWKSQMLRNLNMYVSRNRLVIHNLPPTWDDHKLRELVRKHSGVNADIREARIMRDLRNVDAKGVGKSKELGFVSFSDHEYALKVLRSLNNNPNVFSKARRPIVAFSIENKVMVNAKQKRLQKSKQRNPYCKEFNPEVKKSDIEDNKISRKRKYHETKQTTEDNVEYVGLNAKPGTQKMRSKFKLRTQAKIHHENVKNEKKKSKFVKRKKEQNVHVRMKEPRMKQTNKKKKSDDNFSNLVNKYRTSISAVPFKKSKWYE